MKKLNLFSNLWSSLVGSQKDNGSTRLRVVFDSFTCRYRLSMHLCSIFTALFLLSGVGQMWGGVDTSEFTSSSFSGKSAHWSTSANASNYEAARGAQWYKDKSTTFTATDFTNVTSVHVWVARSSSGTGSVKIQENTTAKKTISSFSTSSTEEYYSWGTASPYTGTVNVVVNATANSLYMKKIVVTFLTSITLNANGGAANRSATFDHEATSATSFTACTRDGYTCTGYWTASSGGTKILNANGTLAGANITVSTVDYTSSSKWVYAGATLTLYAQWEAAASCTATPSIGAASLNGSFNLSTVGVSCASSGAGTNCSITEYGWVWSDGANNTDPLIGGSNVTNSPKTSGAPSGTGGSFTGELSSTFTVDHTYYYKAYVTNGKPATTYSSVQTFTPRSITFDSNGGSSVSTIYLNSGSTATEPTAPTKTGSVFAGWYSNEGLTTAVDWSSTISTSKTYYAKWYTVTVNVKDEAGNSLSGTGKPTASCSGTTLSTSAGSEKYVFKEWEVSNTAALGSSKTTASNSLTSITGNVTVTAIYHAPITLTKGTNTGASTFNFSSNPIGYGETLTITCAADASHKGNPTVTASGTHGAISVVSATSVTIANVQSAMTVNISYAAKESAVVKLHVAGSTSTVSGTRYEGDSYTLPSEATECPDLGLYGWYTEAYSDEDDAPTGAKYKAPGASSTLVAGVNDFYAVYATVTPDAANTYTKISSTEQLVTGDYLIVAHYSTSLIEAMKNTVNASDYMDEVNVASNVNNTSTPTTVSLDSDNPAIRWRITKSSTNVSIYNANVSKYFSATTGTPALINSAEYFSYSVSSGDWALTSNSKTLYYSYFFYVGTPSSAKPIYLFKRDPGITGPYTTSPSCVTHTLTVDMNPVSPDGCSASAAKTILGEEKTTTATATAGAHYDFSYWTISGTGAAMSNTSDGKSTDNPVTVTMGTEDATLIAHFTEKAKCTVVFKNNEGSAISSTTYWDGETPTAPTLTDGASNDACDATSDKHYGWTRSIWTKTIDQDSVNNRTSAALRVHPKAIALPAITAADDGKTITYHAVWAKATGSASDEFQLVTDVNDLSVGDKIVLAHDYTGSVYLIGKDTTTLYNDAFNYQYRKYTQTTYTVSTDKITLTSVATSSDERNKPFVLTIGKSGDYWTFYDEVNGGYLYAAANSDSESDHYNKNLLALQDELTNAGKWSISIASNLATITSQTTETDRKLLQRNGTTNTGIFNCYANTQTNPCIFRSLSSVSYSKFLTTCCTDTVRLATPSITGSGTVTFDDGSPVSTCGGAKTVTATVTPATGYKCTALSFSGGSVSVSPATASSVPFDVATDFELTFAKNTSPATLTTSATFAQIPVSGWSFTNHRGGAAITDATLVVYVGQKVQLDITYSPANAHADHKAKEQYSQTSVSTYILSPTKASAYFTFTGKASTSGSTTTIALTHNDGPTKDVNVEVRPLPSDTYLDLIHGVVFASQTASLSDENYGVDFSYTAPGSDTPDWTGSYKNDCEEESEHLIGWIDSEWADKHLGDIPTTSEVTAAKLDDGTTPAFHAKGESMIAANRTYYAVWAKIE
ncbi:MAG: InlB B-repeat-containing protein [Paludibacteraceae bacterium]|nr:InlB B-repeat-containing protein [Paludibacteraceae bacterium]